VCEFECRGVCYYKSFNADELEDEAFLNRRVRGKNHFGHGERSQRQRAKSWVYAIAGGRRQQHDRVEYSRGKRRRAPWVVCTP
jgi:hypothetical protein